MKDVSIGDYLKWNGQLAQVVGYIDRKCAVIEIQEPRKCPHCDGDLGKQKVHSIISSPQFQQSAEKIETITEDSTSK